VKTEYLTQQLIEAAGIMTVEQLHVMIPLLSPNQIRHIFTLLEHDSQVEEALSMIDDKKTLIELLKNEDLLQLQRDKEDLEHELQIILDKNPQTEERIRNLSSTEDISEYESIVRTVKNTKTTIENLQRSVREIQSALKLPNRILCSQENTFLHERFEKLAAEVKEVGKRVHAEFVALSSANGLLVSLERQWETIRRNLQPTVDINNESDCGSDSMVDDELAIKLYEAVKVIGNPVAVGSEHYPMSWNDIIQAGFRESVDFRNKGITSLEQLQQYIHQTNKTKSSG